MILIQILIGSDKGDYATLKEPDLKKNNIINVVGVMDRTKKVVKSRRYKIDK